MARPIYWRWEYRLRARPHVLLVGPLEWLQELKLHLQAQWMLSISGTLTDAVRLACLLQPSRILIGSSLDTGDDPIWVVERLRREPRTTHIPLLFLANSKQQAFEATERGAHRVLAHKTPVEIHLQLLEIAAAIE